jgi:AraC-like DNA-binding protein
VKARLLHDMSIINNIGLITVFLLILLSIFLLSQSSKRKVSNILLAFFLLANSFTLSVLFLLSFYREYVVLNHLRLAVVFLQMPLFFLYVKKICFFNFELEIKHFLHGLPFIGFTILFLVWGITPQIDMVYVVAPQLQFYTYTVWIFFVLIKYKKIHVENHSLQNETYRWLNTTTILFLIGNSFNLFRGILEALNDFKKAPLLNLGISLFGLSVISWFVLKTMRNPELFSSVNENQSEPKKSKIEDKQNYSEEVDQLLIYMNSNKPYLEEALTLQELSVRTGIPLKHLSFLINQIIGKRFFDFINAYRVEESKSLLQVHDLTIQQIMYRVGFNSKSSFNTAFKKYTATTPSKYRQALN